jgi:hypothetical protein
MVQRLRVEMERSGRRPERLRAMRATPAHEDRARASRRATTLTGVARLNGTRA